MRAGSAPVEIRPDRARLCSPSDVMHIQNMSVVHWREQAVAHFNLNNELKVRRPGGSAWPCLKNTQIEITMNVQISTFNIPKYLISDRPTREA